MKLPETVLEKKKTVCGTMRANRAVLHNSEKKTRKLKQGQSSFWKEDDIMVQVWKDKKRLVSIIRTIHKQKLLKQKGMTKKLEVKKACCVFQHDKYIKGLDKAGQFLCCYLVLKKTVKWLERWYCIS
jgi:hypothetical protein